MGPKAALPVSHLYQNGKWNGTKPRMEDGDTQDYRGSEEMAVKRFWRDELPTRASC